MAVHECRKGSGFMWKVLSACQYYGDFDQVFNLVVKVTLSNPIELSVNGGDWGSATKHGLNAKESDFYAILKVIGYESLAKSPVKSITVTLQNNSAASVCVDMLCVEAG